MTNIEEISYNVPDLDKLFPITSKALKMFGVKIIYAYSLANILVFISTSVGLLIYGLIILNKQYWLEIGIIIITIVSMIVQVFANLFYYNIWKNWKIIYANQLSWNFHNISPNAKNKINSLCKRVKISFVGCCCMEIFATASAQIDIVPHLSRFIQSIELIGTLQRYIPFLHQILVISLVVSTQFMAVLITMALYYPYYFYVLTRTQFYILQDNINMFQENMPAATDNNSHCYVKKGLRKIIKRHHDIWNLLCRVNKEQVPLLFLVNVSLLICIMFNTILLYSPYYTFTPPIIIYSTTLITAFYFSNEGQSFEDLVDDISDSLYNLNWYDWNIENQKAFRIFFGINRPLKIHGSMNTTIQINRGLFKQAVKMAYTLVNLARTVSHK